MRTVYVDKKLVDANTIRVKVLHDLQSGEHNDESNERVRQMRAIQINSIARYNHNDRLIKAHAYKEAKAREEQKRLAEIRRNVQLQNKKLAIEISEMERAIEIRAEREKFWEEF